MITEFQGHEKVILKISNFCLDTGQLIDKKRKDINKKSKNIL